MGLTSLCLPENNLGCAPAAGVHDQVRLLLFEESIGHSDIVYLSAIEITIPLFVAEKFETFTDFPSFCAL
jgi:hypothetical protein